MTVQTGIAPDDRPDLPENMSAQVGFRGFLNRFLASKLTWFGLFLIGCFVESMSTSPVIIACTRPAPTLTVRSGRFAYV